MQLLWGQEGDGCPIPRAGSPLSFICVLPRLAVGFKPNRFRSSRSCSGDNSKRKEEASAGGLSVRLCCQGWCLFLGCLLLGLSASGRACACPTHEQFPVRSPVVPAGLEGAGEVPRPSELRGRRVCAEPAHVWLPPALPRPQAVTVRADRALLPLTPRGHRELGGQRWPHAPHGPAEQGSKAVLGRQGPA